SGYIGVSNFMGDRFTTSADHMRPVLGVLKSRGLMFLDAQATRNSVAARVALDLGVPRALNNRFIDSEASRIAIDARLFELERIATSVGTAVGIGFPYPVTIERIASWASTLADKGLILAPLSAVANRQDIQ
ncbi:MAG TPA: divergent polysaccharide deacetylase family protein, partial [Armatimonadota bacterium]|nr:divergent polysaccharide deacetylase family protein [Armatimonadota bacterium]